jgi:hypothetical protein
MAATRCIRILVWSLAISGAAGAATARPSDPQVAANYSSPPVLRPPKERIVQPYVEDDDASLPAHTTSLPNLDAPAGLRRLVESMVQDSPTFRRQCVRLSAAQHLTIVFMAAVSDPSRSIRASTEFAVSAAGHLVARIYLGPSIGFEELVAHEFEHVLEQLDGVDLAALSRRPSSGVSQVEGSRFETVRAVTIGRQVAEELREARRRHE